MKKLIVFALLLATPASAAEVFGIGNSSCATAMQAGKQYERGAWILGFWTGLNASSDAHVGFSTDARGVIAEVELYCERYPSHKLGQAAYAIYHRFKDRGR